MIVFIVKDGTTRKIKLNIDAKSTIFDLKANVCREMYIKVTEQHLYFNDSELENDKTLESYNITPLSRLRVKCRSEGKRDTVNQQVTSHEAQVTQLEREISVINQKVTGYEQKFGEVEQREIFKEKLLAKRHLKHSLETSSWSYSTQLMSSSKPLPPFSFDVMCYMNRDQLERFSIVCRSLKNIIERYFHSKPYRMFKYLRIRGGSYALSHNQVQWHPNQDDYSVQQFLDAQEYNIDDFERSWNGYVYYSFAEMCSYLGPTVRINWTSIDVTGGPIFNPEHIEEMESISYLWRDSDIGVGSIQGYRMIVAEDFLPVLNSPTILQCRILYMDNVHFPFIDYKVLYTVKVIETSFRGGEVVNSWLEFLEQPGVKPLIVISAVRREITTNILDRLCKVFSSAVLPNAFKMLLTIEGESLIKFRKTNKSSGEILELKKGVPSEYQQYFEDDDYILGYSYFLERTST